jgi:molecular chaperone Hsp33
MKPHPDSLQRFLFEQSHVRGELVHLDDAWRAVLERHDYPPSLRAVMGGPRVFLYDYRQECRSNQQ